MDINNDSKPENEVNNTPKGEDKNSEKKEYDTMIEDYKELFGILKKFGKFLIEKVGIVLSFFGYLNEYEYKIKMQKAKYEKEYRKEIDNFERERQRIIAERTESIRKIHIKKNNTIKESNDKCNKILSYLDTIKNDRGKLIEFLSQKNIF